MNHDDETQNLPEDARDTSRSLINQVLAELREFRAEAKERFDAIAQRLTAIETEQRLMRRELQKIHGSLGQHEARLDELEDNLVATKAA